MPRAFTFFLATTFATLFGAAHAAERADFKVYLSGIKIGNVGFTLNETKRAYRGTGYFKTSGMAGLFYSVDFKSKVEGGFRKGIFSPNAYSETSITGKGRLQKSLNYRGGVARFVTSEKTEPFWVDPSTQKHTVDPLSATIAMLRDRKPNELCKLSLRYFDGARRLNARITSPQKTNEGVTCKGVFERKGGYSKKQMKEGNSFSFEMEYGPLKNGMHQVSRLVFSSPRGRAVLLRQ